MKAGRIKCFASWACVHSHPLPRALTRVKGEPDVLDSIEHGAYASPVVRGPHEDCGAAMPMLPAPLAFPLACFITHIMPLHPVFIRPRPHPLVVRQIMVCFVDTPGGSCTFGTFS